MEHGPLKRTPLWEAHRRLGARMVPFAGFEMPLQYTSVIREHLAVRRRAGLFDVSHMGEVRVEGAEALDLLQWLTCNDVGRLEPGRAQYNAILNERGGVVDDCLVYCLEPGAYWVVVNAANRDRDLRWMQEHAQGRQVRVLDQSDDTALIALQGPRAEAMLQRFTPEPLETLRSFRFRPGRVAGRPVLISRTGYTGEDGFELYLAAGDAPEVWARLLEGDDEATPEPAGLAARDTLRLEAGMLLHGQDMDETTTVLEADLEWIVRWDKGAFVGKEALEAQRREGLRRKRVGFVMRGRAIARHGYPVWAEGEQVGQVTSGSYAPFLEKNIGLAYVPLVLAEPGTIIEIGVRGRREPAEVVPTPFYRRPRRR